MVIVSVYFFKFYITNFLDNYDKYLDFEPEYLSECLEKDLNLKNKEEVDEDNFVFDIFKDDHNKLLDFINQGEDFSKYEDELDDNRDFLVEKLDIPKQIQKQIWGSYVPTMIDYYNDSIVNPENKLFNI